MWKQTFPRRFNVEYTWCVCWVLPILPLYENQSTDLSCKLFDWFPNYENIELKWDDIHNDQVK